MSVLTALKHAGQIAKNYAGQAVSYLSTHPNTAHLVMWVLVTILLLVIGRVRERDPDEKPPLMVGILIIYWFGMGIITALTAMPHALSSSADTTTTATPLQSATLAAVNIIMYSTLFSIFAAMIHDSLPSSKSPLKKAVFALAVMGSVMYSMTTHLMNGDFLFNNTTIPPK